jgi:hypothetical protein
LRGDCKLLALSAGNRNAGFALQAAAKRRLYGWRTERKIVGGVLREREAKLNLIAFASGAEIADGLRKLQ